MESDPYIFSEVVNGMFNNKKYLIDDVKSLYLSGFILILCVLEFLNSFHDFEMKRRKVEKISLDNCIINQTISSGSTLLYYLFNFFIPMSKVDSENNSMYFDSKS